MDAKISRLFRQSLDMVWPLFGRSWLAEWHSSLGAPASAKNAVFGWKPSRSDMDANYTFLSTDEVVELHRRYSPLDHFQQSEERSRRAA